MQLILIFISFATYNFTNHSNTYDIRYVANFPDRLDIFQINKVRMAELKAF